MNKLLSNKRGFTLIELLVVIGILAVLLAIVLIAINPSRQFAQANNTKRHSDVNAILNSVHQYMADNKGNLTGLGTISTDPTTPTAISSAGIGNGFCNALLTQYIAALPVDPGINNGIAVVKASCVPATAWDTGYKMYVTSPDNRLTVMAPATELSIPVIAVTR